MNRWRTWMVGCLLGSAAATGFAADNAVVVQRVMQTEIGASADSFYLVEALRRSGQKEDADLLGRFLLTAYVDEVAGQKEPSRRTVESAIGLARKIPAADDADLRARWDKQVNANLVVSLPSGQATFSADLGVAVTVSNRAPVPLLFTDFALVPRQQPSSLRLQCAPGRENQMASLRPGLLVDYLCRAQSVGGNEPAPAAAVVQALARPAAMRVETHQFDTEGTREWLLKVVARSQATELELLLGTPAAPSQSSRSALGVTGPPVIARAQPAAAPPQAAASVPKYTPLPRVIGIGEQLTGMRPWVQWVAFGAVVAVYFGCASLIGNLAAALALGVVGTIAAIVVVARGPSIFYNGVEGYVLFVVYAGVLILPALLAKVLFFIVAVATSRNKLQTAGEAIGSSLFDND